MDNKLIPVLFIILIIGIVGYIDIKTSMSGQNQQNQTEESRNNLESIQNCKHDTDCVIVSYKCEYVAVNNADFEEFTRRTANYSLACNAKDIIDVRWFIPKCVENLCTIKFDCSNCARVLNEQKRLCEPTPCTFCNSICNAFNGCGC